MDSNAIKEIATQLGVGTDYLLAHLAEFAPKWAALKIAESGSSVLVAAITLCIVIHFSRVLVVEIRKAKKERALGRYVDDCDRYIAVAVLMVLGFIAALALAVNVSSILAYAIAPDAALVRDALSAMALSK